MEDWKLGAVESRFADLIWDNAPLPSRELVGLAEQTLNWKKSTTYTVLRKLCERGIFVNSDGMVDARISRDGFYARQSEAVCGRKLSRLSPRLYRRLYLSESSFKTGNIGTAQND